MCVTSHRFHRPGSYVISEGFTSWEELAQLLKRIEKAYEEVIPLTCEVQTFVKI